jgi:hypothetical protein
MGDEAHLAALNKIHSGAQSAVSALNGAESFSLFDGDWLNRVYSKLSISSHARFGIFKRCMAVVMLTWIPVAILALVSGHASGGLIATNFFADFAAYAQFLVGLPLFMVAEPVIDRSTRGVAKQLISCGIVRPEDRGRLYDVHRLIARMRRPYWSDLICILIAFSFSAAILIPEFGPHPLPTWHVGGNGQWPMLTAPGIWEFLIALPLMNYTWMRLIWKILLWIFYLERVARMHLDLHPTHPDLTGGIGFISEAQGRFAIFILAYGISNVAATVGYEIVILHYNFEALPVWGPLILFAVGAPLLFTTPLLMFTNQLYRSKSRALAVYRERVTAHSRSVESRWFKDNPEAQSTSDEIRQLAELTTLNAMFSHIQNMRVVPFDLRSLAQLLGSSFGSVATVLPFLHFNGQLTNIFEVIGKLFGHLVGGN